MKKPLMILVVAATIAIVVFYSNQKHALTYALQYEHYSNTLSEHRVYSVALPADYESSVQYHYPVVYLLDGEKHLLQVAGMIHSLRAGLYPDIPPVIIVGIHNTDRMRDYTPSYASHLPNGEKSGANYQNTGGSSAFLTYLETELKPRIQQQYRTTKTSILIGHSLGGLLALDAIHQRLNMFQGYICIDPSLWFNYPTHFSSFKKSFLLEFNQPTSLYLSIANNPYTPSLGRSYLHRNTLLDFAAAIKDHSDSNLHIKSVYEENKNHHSIYQNAVSQGLQWLFRGYQLGLDHKELSAKKVMENYQVLNARLNSDLKPEKHYLNRLLKRAKRWPEMGIPVKEISQLISTYYPEKSIK